MRGYQHGDRSLGRPGGGAGKARLGGKAAGLGPPVNSPAVEMAPCREMH